MQDTACFTLIANLVGSRKVEDRITLPLSIESALQEIALRWPDAWVTPPIATRDSNEISAVMKSPRHAFDFAVELNLSVWPARFRVAMTAGHSDLASATLKRAEKSGLLFAVQLSGLPMTTLKLIESSARLHANIMRDWKPSRAAAAATMRKTETQQAAAEALGIRQQSVSEALRAAHAKDLASLEEAVRACLTQA